MFMTIFWFVLILVLLFIIFFFITHSILKALSFAVSIAIIVSIVLGLLIVYDAFQFQNKAMSEPMVFSLESGGSTVTGFVVSIGNSNSSEFLSQDEINFLNAGDYDALLNKYYKIWIIDMAIFDDLKTENFMILGKNLSKQQVRELLLSHELALKLNLTNTDEEIKAYLLQATIINDLFKNPVLLFDEYKKGNIRIYKETLMFKFFKIIPLNYIKKAFVSTVSRIKRGEQDVISKKA